MPLASNALQLQRLNSRLFFDVAGIHSLASILVRD